MRKIRSGNHTLNTEPIGSFRTTHRGVYFLTFRMTGQQLEVGGGGLVLTGGGSANFMQVNFCKVTRTVFCCFKIFNKNLY